MSDMNFVPDDYVITKEAKRSNIFYIALFVLVMMALGVTFGVIKIRQSKLQKQEDAVDLKLKQACKELSQIEVMQTKRKELMNTALMASDLIEPIPRSVLLAAVTNAMPDGVSIIKLKLDEKVSRTRRRSNYDKKKSASKKGKVSKKKKTSKKSKKANTKKPEPLMLRTVVIEGLSPTDIEVAEYIAILSGCHIFEDVELTKSEEVSVEGFVFRRFELKSTLKNNFTVTEKDVTQIKNKLFSAK